MKRCFRLVETTFALIAVLPTPARAAPPPPPPSYVMDVAHILTGDAGPDTITQLSQFVGDDVSEYVNDRLVVTGKSNWLRNWSAARHSRGRVLGYSPDRRDNGTLMIADEYDTVDRSNLPRNFVADPRWTSRATLYQFGADHKIHVIRTILGGGFWIKP